MASIYLDPANQDLNPNPADLDRAAEMIRASLRELGASSTLRRGPGFLIGRSLFMVFPPGRGPGSFPSPCVDRRRPETSSANASMRAFCAAESDVCALSTSIDVERPLANRSRVTSSCAEARSALSLARPHAAFRALVGEQRPPNVLGDLALELELLEVERALLCSRRGDLPLDSPAGEDRQRQRSTGRIGRIEVAQPIAVLARRRPPRQSSASAPREQRRAVAWQPECAPRMPAAPVAPLERATARPRRWQSRSSVPERVREPHLGPEIGADRVKQREPRSVVDRCVRLVALDARV